MKTLIITFLVFSLAGCQSGLLNTGSTITTAYELLGVNSGTTHADLLNLPQPKGKIIVSIYSFRDQTGQYKESPSSTFSTAIPQGTQSLLISALLNSKWFIPVERENLQNLLTERKITQTKSSQNIKPLIPASILLEGGIISFDANIKTGGIGLRYLGIGPSTQYRMDLVTISLRAVDSITGEIIDSVTTTKKIYSKENSTGVFKFIRYKELLEIESGYTNNEPVILCINEAIESAVIRLILRGIKNNKWSMEESKTLDSILVDRYF